MNNHKKKAFIGLCLVTVVLSLGFISLYVNESSLLKGIVTFSDYEEDSTKVPNTFVLHRGINDKELADFLLTKGIYSDSKDALCVSYWIASRLRQKGLPNLGALNKSDFRIPADTAAQLGGNKIHNALSSSLYDLGITDEVNRLYSLLGENKFKSGSIVSFPDDSVFTVNSDSILSRKNAGVPLTKVSIHVIHTCDSVDALKVSHYGLSKIPYVGDKIAQKLLSRKKQAKENQEGIPDVLIRIKDHNENKRGVVLGYALTNSDGVASVYLPSDGFFSFLPVKEGFEFGGSKGTKKGILGADAVDYVFRQKKHTIRLLDSQTYQRIKEDVVLSVRSPQQYKKALVLYSFLFFIAWWLLFFFLACYDIRKRTQTDHIIPLALMSMSGIGLLAMFSIVHPLTDTLLGTTMTAGAIVGILFLALVSCVDWGYFYSVGIRTRNHIVQFDFVLQLIRWIALPFKEKIQSRKVKQGASISQILGYYFNLIVSVLIFPIELLFRLIYGIVWTFDWIVKHITLIISKKPSENTKHWARQPFAFSIPKGVGYLIIVLLFIFLLFLFGDGPEGSDTKVNLFFFQPSELNKYLAVLFMASFFAVRADRITLFSDEVDLDWFHFRLHLKSVLLILFSLAILLLLYLIVMSDMGPGLVLIVTFVFLYSIARKDFKQMIIGIASFLLMVWLGGRFKGDSLVPELLFATVWLLGWLTFWYVKEKRLYESAIFFNLLLSAFIFIGPLLAKTNVDKFRSVGQRIVNRNAVVGSSIWDNQVPGGGDQVVQGVWSLASGGFSGQGLGKGNPNLVPAFHTDMIFTSIGEEMGWASLVLIILCLAIIIHRSLIIAYKSGDRFLFFLSSGVGIITGVQFFVIIFGAIGIIPLTGVAVPFLSFGMTSLIINLAVFGIILSVSRKDATVNQRQVNRPYRNVTAIGIGAFLTISFMLIAVLFNYQVLQRGKYLKKPAFISNNEGARLAEYNPRINLLLKELGAGTLFDRNGLPLALSNVGGLSFYVGSEGRLSEKRLLDTLGLSKTTTKVLTGTINELKLKSLRRYYPFSRHLLFMLGDDNVNSTLWNSDFGYFAESRLKDRLRGFSTSIKDENGRFKKFELRTKAYSPSAFADKIDTLFCPSERDYSQLVPFLKDGIHGRKVAKWNEVTAEGKRDIYLTLDANLQTTLQEQMRTSLAPQPKGINSQTRPKIRASVVILNARDGDLLCSANYPLPNPDTINFFLNIKKDYVNYEKQWDRPTFTERDLGLTYPTAPGSTAKIMSAIAGFMKLGDDLIDVKYHIEPNETIEGSAKEPNSSNSSPNLTYQYPDPRVKMKVLPASSDNCSHLLKNFQLVNLENAIVWSSNNYFINLVHNKELYHELGKLYETVGARVATDTSKSRNIYFPSYIFEPQLFSDRMRKEYDNWVEYTSNRALRVYNNRMEKHENGVYEPMNQGDLMWAWGQGTLDASPLTMARVISIVYNEGRMPKTRYVFATGSKKKQEPIDYIQVITSRNANKLKGYMKEETRKHREVLKVKHKSLPSSMGGKTGTPERRIKFVGGKAPIKANDGWYICFVDTEYGTNEKKTETPLAIAVRLERVGVTSKNYGETSGSGAAVSFVENTVLPALKNCNYHTK